MQAADNIGVQRYDVVNVLAEHVRALVEVLHRRGIRPRGDRAALLCSIACGFLRAVPSFVGYADFSPRFSRRRHVRAHVVNSRTIWIFGSPFCRAITRPLRIVKCVLFKVSSALDRISVWHDASILPLGASTQ